MDLDEELVGDELRPHLGLVEVGQDAQETPRRLRRIAHLGRIGEERGRDEARGQELAVAVADRRAFHGRRRRAMGARGPRVAHHHHVDGADGEGAEGQGEDRAGNEQPVAGYFERGLGRPEDLDTCVLDPDAGFRRHRVVPVPVSCAAGTAARSGRSFITRIR